MSLISKNPYTEEIIATFDEHSKEEVEVILEQSKNAFKLWKNISVDERIEFFNKFADILEKDKLKFAKIITLEMGRPITFAVSEIEKCVRCIKYYTENSKKFLTEEVVITEAKKSVVRYEPLGTILAVMPWNFPFWQSIRFIAPTLIAGNVGLLKHSSNVPQSGIVIEQTMLEAGIPKGVFQHLKVVGKEVGDIIDDDRVMGVTLTGSEHAGSQVASRAGKNIKKTVLELGGSDPFIICADVDLEKIIPIATAARLRNGGQTCVSAKRFIVHKSLYESFIPKLKISFEGVIMGDPMDEKTIMGPLATESIRDEIAKLVDSAKEMGAKVITGGEIPNCKGYFYPPTILTDVKKEMPIYYEETFGPVAVVFPFETTEEAIKIANDTRFGLGASIWTNDMELAEKFSKEINAGSVFVNTVVASDPRLPFGGIKKSGFGRELASNGIREFTNIKTVWIA